MGQLQGNTDLNIALAGRATSNPLVGKADLALAFAAKADVNVNLAAKFGLGFVNIIPILTELDEIIRKENNSPILMEEQVV
jgi:hypothetical protein